MNQKSHLNSPLLRFTKKIKGLKKSKQGQMLELHALFYHRQEEAAISVSLSLMDHVA